MASTQVVSLGHQRVGDVIALDVGLDGMLHRLIADLAGTELERRLLGDQLAAFGGIFLGEQRRRGDLVELGIAVVGVAIGVGQLEGFHQGVNVVGRVEAQCPECRSLPEC